MVDSRSRKSSEKATTPEDDKSLFSGIKEKLQDRFQDNLHEIMGKIDELKGDTSFSEAIERRLRKSDSLDSNKSFSSAHSTHTTVIKSRHNSSNEKRDVSRDVSVESDVFENVSALRDVKLASPVGKLTSTTLLPELENDATYFGDIAEDSYFATSDSQSSKSKAFVPGEECHVGVFDLETDANTPAAASALKLHTDRFNERNRNNSADKDDSSSSDSCPRQRKGLLPETKSFSAANLVTSAAPGVVSYSASRDYDSSASDGSYTPDGAKVNLLPNSSSVPGLSDLTGPAVRPSTPPRPSRTSRSSRMRSTSNKKPSVAFTTTTQRVIVVVALVAIYIAIPIQAYMSGLILGVAIGYSLCYFYMWAVEPKPPLDPFVPPDLRVQPPLVVPRYKSASKQETVFKVHVFRLLLPQPLPYLTLFYNTHCVSCISVDVTWSWLLRFQLYNVCIQLPVT